MNQDFHYYATLVAARFAGFSNEEADVIANAAQYVDEHCEDLIKRKELKKLGVEPTITCMQLIEYEKYYINTNPTGWSNEELCELQGIWMPFHFLPGNLEGRLSYEGEDRYRNNQALLRRFQLTCTTNSELLKQALNATIASYNDTRNLCRVGLMMHVLADTWAHTWFIGRPERYINNISSPRVKDRGNWLEVKRGSEDCPEKHEYYFFPVKFLTEQGISYLGHAQAGHMPDYSYLHYSYIPEWKSKSGNPSVEKNNPSDFYKAFAQMIYALKCIRSSKEFSLDQYDSMQDYQQYEADYQSALTAPQTDASLSWLNLSKKVMGKMPYTYDRNYFTNEFLEAQDRSQTLYYKFSVAARDHYLLVEDYLKQYGFSLRINN